MNTEAARLLAAAIAVGFVSIAALGVGYIGGKTNEALGRNPEVSTALRTNMILVVAVSEGIVIFALVVAVLILFVAK